MGPIGIFDSGLGGLTVLREIAARVSNPLIYFGDTARVPYGGKSRETIVRYSLENADFLIRKGAKAIVIACNTASVLAGEIVRSAVDVPVIDVVGPGIESASAASSGGVIALLGTKATIRSGVYQRGIEEKLPGSEVISIACPLFVPLVEENLFDHPATRLFVEEYLSPLKGIKVDAVLLACTHYPLIRNLIQEEVGKEVAVIDSAKACAEKVAECMGMHGPCTIPPQVYVSDAPEDFKRASEAFLGFSVGEVNREGSFHLEEPSCIEASPARFP